MKKIVCIVLAFSFVVFLFGCSGVNGAQASQAPAATPSQSTAQSPSASPTATLSLVPTQSPSASPTGTQTGLLYQNSEFGFSFSLPDSWKGYTIVTSQWQGSSTDTDEKSPAPAITGPELSIRHPLWTKQNPRQDIPIIIFTLAQWDDLQQDKFHIGAAPINPTLLGKNSKYVFALPARYNYAFPTGYEEVDKILQSNPLHPNEDIGEVS